jgi:hypothetical protein
MATNYFRDVFERNGLSKRGTATYENPQDNLTPANVQAILEALALLSNLPASLQKLVDPLSPDLRLDHLWTYIASWPHFEATRLVSRTDAPGDVREVIGKQT